jgi:NADPH2:quinone reductase
MSQAIKRCGAEHFVGRERVTPFLIVAYGAASNEPMLVDAAHMLGGNLGVCGFYLGAHLADAERMKRQFSRLMGWVESGRITVLIGGCFPLGEAARAHALLESRQSTGKLILKP